MLVNGRAGLNYISKPMRKISQCQIDQELHNRYMKLFQLKNPLN